MYFVIYMFSFCSFGQFFKHLKTFFNTNLQAILRGQTMFDFSSPMKVKILLSWVYKLKNHIFVFMNTRSQRIADLFMFQTAESKIKDQGFINARSKIHDPQYGGGNSTTAGEVSKSLATSFRQLSIHGNVGASFWWRDALPHTN